MEPPADDKPAGSAGRRAVPARRRWGEHRKAVILAGVALVLAAWAGHWLYLRFTHVYIDDARIDGEVVTIASRVSGWITELPVIEGDEVKTGQVIATIDSRDSELQREALVSKLRAIESEMAAMRAQTGQVDQETLGKYQSEESRVAAAEADTAALETQLKQAQDDYKRAQDIAQYITQQEIDRARTAYRQAQESLRKSRAEIAAARGNLSAVGGSRRQLLVIERRLAVLEHQAGEVRAGIRRQEIDIADRTIASPSDGKVVMTFVHKGEHVMPGQRIAMFHAPDDIWVEANVKETDIGAVKPGMKAEVRVDAYPDRVFHGEVFRVGQVATSKFALLPDPNPSGNFTRITQRLPVRIVLTDKDRALRPGMMVEVAIALRND
ncbi:MAG TPA: HlyD family secretion protein [Burkholderiales bacterium]|nr:HlyD family secretion protein [Burkholderiales bacterium]